MQRMITSLGSVFRRYPVLPNMLSFSVLFPAANLVQQKCFRHKSSEDRIDWKEVSRFFVYGGLFQAPLVYNWLRVATKLFPSSQTSHILAKVVMDQICFAPVALSSFYIWLSVMEGKDRAGVYNEWRDKFPNTWATGVFIIPLLLAFNFRFVPANFRPVFVGFYGFFWFSYLAYLKSRPGTFQAPVFKLYDKYVRNRMNENLVNLE